MMVRNKKTIVSGALLCALLFFVSGGYLTRPLWFDEALTVQNFALLDSCKSIYFNYAIPNNQLLYSMALHLWIQLYGGLTAPDDWMRLLSLIFAAVTMIYTFRRFRIAYTSGVMAVVLVSFCCAPPFLLHATALRGYMAGACFTMLALGAALDFTVSGGFPAWARYFFFSLCSVAVLPSDLPALGGVVLYALPCCGNAFLRSRRFYLLALTPPAAFLCFYLPIFPSLLRVAQVGSSESWKDLTGVLQAVYLPQLFTFAMLLLPCSAIMLFWKRSRFNYLRTARAGVWLLPLLCILLLPSPPFPRVFFPFFPLFALLAAAGLRDYSAIYCRLKRRFHPGFWFCGLLVLSLSWCCLQQSTWIRSAFSSRCGGAAHDDFYYPYYLRPAHLPDCTAKSLACNEALRESPAFYLTFDSDPWPLMFYLKLNGVGTEHFLFDGPRGPVKELPRLTTVILNARESQPALARRFPGQWRPVFRNDNHQVWSYSL